ncbi:uncharacterized protein LOC133804340 isoform X2 [Humulus lupulus]|uniref:uncharacterized protein LOC133804340 isoform X2 n=1 Tax=Humulus lupulus TaxID=3486 RepID=UPI002B418561|nr:uncharacterized protein LOC133804340 isoform X2 [Humulus lupulus]
MKTWREGTPLVVVGSSTQLTLMANYYLTMSMAPSPILTRSPLLPSSPSTASRFVKPLRCARVQQQQGWVCDIVVIYPDNGPVILKVEGGILCEPCNGRGWLVCEFCKGQKTNVKAENNRIYRRCPSCRACRLDMSCVQVAKYTNV